MKLIIAEILLTKIITSRFCLRVILLCFSQFMNTQEGLQITAII